MEYASRHLHCTPAPSFLPRFRLSSPHTWLLLNHAAAALRPCLPSSSSSSSLGCLMPRCATLPRSDSSRVLVSDGVLVNPASSPVVCVFFFFFPSATHHRRSINPLHAPGVWLGRAPGPDPLLLPGACSCQHGDQISKLKLVHNEYGSTPASLSVLASFGTHMHSDCFLTRDQPEACCSASSFLHFPGPAEAAEDAK